MSAFWELQTLQQVTAGRWIRRPQQHHHLIAGLSIDSRSLIPGQIFIAIRGERTDGHRYIADAVTRGAGMILIEDESAVDAAQQITVPVLLVPKTSAALSQIAKAYRKHFSAKVIAITGSVGKTTTRQITHHLLSETFRGSAAIKSFNNHLGVPLTLGAVKAGDRYVVCEVGTSRPGEISRLSAIAEPDIAMVTAIGEAHLEELGSLEGVAEEKASIYRHLRPGGLAIACGDYPLLKRHLVGIEPLISYGQSDGCDLRLTQLRTTQTGSAFSINDGQVEFHLPLVGRHNALNALGAIAVARHMGMTDQQIAERLATVEAYDRRMQKLTLGPADQPITVLNDAYNANPTSMAAALQTLAEQPCKAHRVVALGDMLELGETSESAHQRLAQQIRTAQVDCALLIGLHMKKTYEELCKDSPHMDDAYQWFEQWGADAQQWLIEHVGPGDAVLSKGSRAMAMEQAVEAVSEHYAKADAPNNTTP